VFTASHYFSADFYPIAPAQEALQSELKVFTVGKPPLYPFTVYQGTDEEADRAWGELYNRKCITSIIFFTST
jgi:hypothetical protein